MGRNDHAFFVVSKYNRHTDMSVALKNGLLLLLVVLIGHVLILRAIIDSTTDASNNHSRRHTTQQRDTFLQPSSSKTTTTEKTEADDATTTKHADVSLTKVMDDALYRYVFENDACTTTPSSSPPTMNIPVKGDPPKIPGAILAATTMTSPSPSSTVETATRSALVGDNTGEENGGGTIRAFDALDTAYCAFGSLT